MSCVAHSLPYQGQVSQPYYMAAMATHGTRDLVGHLMHRAVFGEGSYPGLGQLLW